MAIIGLQKGSGKRSRVREKSVKSQGIFIWIMSGNPELVWEKNKESRDFLIIFNISQVALMSEWLRPLVSSAHNHLTAVVSVSLMIDSA